MDRHRHRVRASVLIRSIFTLALAAVVIATPSARAQIIYNVLAPGGEQLRQINPDGSNNVTLAVGNLPQNSNPMLSADGRFLSVRSQDPGRPFTFSTNVYVADRLSGEVRKITNFEDATDPQSGATFNHSPRYTTFSPNGSLILVSDFLNTQAAQGGSTTNFTSVHRTSDGELVDGPSVIGSSSTLSTVGVGVSWSPADNRVAIPATASNGGTAIFSGNSLFNLPARQETFPQQGQFANGNSLENDAFATYSPNGQALAYFRSRNVLTFSGAQPSGLSLRIKSPAGDRSIFNFNPGFQPSGLAWSPDGTELIAGIGPQVSDGGVFFNLADTANSELLVFNVDGSGISRNLGPGYAPTWASLTLSSIAGDFDGSGIVGQGDLNLVLGNWGRNTASAGVPSGWVNEQPGGVIGQEALNAVLQNWGSDGPASLDGFNVPEPSGLLSLLGGGWLLGRRR
jgi:hypothetical protein